jgi:hypothetical protein
VWTIDAVTWQAVGLTLTVLGLALSLVLWRRRGAATGVRALAWALLPLAAALTGTLRLLWQIADAVVQWALRLVFSPLVWLGVGLAAVSVALFALSGLLGRRSSGRGSAGAAVTAPGPASRGAVSGAGRSGAGRPAISDDGDLADIEAILRKHGIS